jgi:prepilin-type processing-associated H-X9-DG protein
MYTSENHDLFPYDAISGQDPRLGGYEHSMWQQLLLPYVGGQPKSLVCSRFNLTQMVNDLRTRPVNPVPDLTEDNMNRYNSYYWFCTGPFPMFGYNHYGLACGGYGQWFGCPGTGNGKLYIQNTVGKISDPSQRIMCMDFGYSYAIPLWHAMGDLDWQMSYYTPDELRHRGGENFAFVDGHVEWDKISLNSRLYGINSKRYWIGEEGAQVKQRPDGSVVSTITLD